MAVKVNDMFYAYSKQEDINQKGEYGGVVTTFQEITKSLIDEIKPRKL